jgi:hypothetical protein
MVMFRNASSTATTTVVATSTDDTATTTDEFATSTATSTESESLDFSIFGEGEVVSFDVNGNAFFAGELVAKEVKTESFQMRTLRCRPLKVSRVMKEIL